MNKKQTKKAPPQKSPPARPQRKLTPYELEQRKKRAEAARRAAAREAEIRKKIELENKKRRAAALRTFFYRFLVYLVMLALMLAVYAAVFFINLHKVDKADESDFTYYLADEKKAKLPCSSVIRNDTVYLNLSQIAEKFGVTITGSYSELRFVSDENDEYLRFRPNSDVVSVNGNTIIMSAPCVFDGRDLWVPMDFVTRYIDGISVKYNAKERTITVKRLSYGAEDKAITFILKSAPTVPAILESEDFGSIPSQN